MPYRRHNWSCNELISDERMNNIEEGISEALECCGESVTPEPLLVQIGGTLNGASCDHQIYTDVAASDVFDAVASGRMVYFVDPFGNAYVPVVYNGSLLTVTLIDNDYQGESGLMLYTFSAPSANSSLRYPQCMQ